MDILSVSSLLHLEQRDYVLFNDATATADKRIVHIKICPNTENILQLR